MKSWTRTLNLDDAHSLLALAEPGLTRAAWMAACHDALPHLSAARRREIVRLLRDGWLDWSDEPEPRLLDGLFLRVYATAPAAAQLDLVDVAWALSHPITLVATDALVAPRLDRADRAVPLDEVDALVAAHIETDADESRRKTRTVLLGAMEGIGTMVTRGTGQHRSLWAARGAPHPLAYGYLVLRDLEERGVAAIDADTALPARLTRCDATHAAACVAWCVERGVLVADGRKLRAGGRYRAG